MVGVLRRGESDVDFRSRLDKLIAELYVETRLDEDMLRRRGRFCWLRVQHCIL